MIHSTRGKGDANEELEIIVDSIVGPEEVVEAIDAQEFEGLGGDHRGRTVAGNDVKAFVCNDR